MKLTVKGILPGSLLIASMFMSSLAVAQRSITLEEFRQLAIRQNNNVKAADENILVAEAQKNQADASGRFTLDGTVTGFYFGKPLSTILPEYGVSPGINFNQPIYAGRKNQLGRDVAANTVNIQTERKTLTTSDVLYNTEVTYWQVVSAKEQINLAEQSQRQLTALVTDINNQYTAGLTYKNDLLRARVQQNQNELSLRQAKDALTLAKLNLAQLTGLGDSVEFVVPDSISGTFDSLQTSDLSVRAQSLRSEIRIQEKTLESARLQERIYKADLLPSVSLGVSGVTAYGKQGINPENNNNTLATYYGLLTVNVPIFGWGKRTEKVKEQQYRIRAQEHQLKDSKEIISLQVQQAILQVNQSARRVTLAALSLVQAEENLRLSKDRLKAGTIVGKDVLDAQTIWQQAYSSVIESKVGYRIAEANLKRALGELGR
ncbi:Outer membrane protein TolC [Chryseolinea serpens]|uniref:Outer membrane protein TolC n=1 Tax=Chryseolinea serpens TaxID=947013 RepID=A0A1M5NZG9_9BACT|nr:TolC family protein [Chryseolinea serpens]SHG94855.1 Outer membrane protein TolC [Chryseolinea serpens]